MPKALREAYLASLGIIALSYNKARKLSIELIKKGELAKEKQQKFITDLLEQSRKNTAEISEIIDKLLKKLNIPTKEDLEEINLKLDELIKKLEKEDNNNEHIQ